jgi:hypothetical protein
MKGMSKRQKLKRMLTRFSDFIIGFILACLVITLGRLALARSIDDEVNDHIKEEFIKIDVAQKRAAMALPDPDHINTLKNEDWSQKRSDSGEELSHSADISPREQSQYLERPRAGFKQALDPLDSIEEKIVENQAYALYREHYRGAMKEVLIQRAHALGIEPTNQMANDATARMIDGEALPYPSTSTPQN